MSELQNVYNQIAAAKFTFLGVFFAVVVCTYAVLVIIDFIPEPVAASDEAVATEAEAAPQVAAADTTTAVVEPTPEPEPEPEPVAVVDPLPLKIIFDSLDKEVEVLNPTSRSVADLDAALLEGVVRHPDSATFADPGNIFILGHSSYLPNVLNKNFQAFNGIQDLTWGDKIRLQSGDREYTYRVDKVYEAKASEVVVPIGEDDKGRLTLATCDSFGATDDRFMVEATLVETTIL